jgi:prepilin-type N-terminal cleavage/methylation domain-containing protein
MKKPNGFSLIELLLSMTLIVYMISGTAEIICLSLKMKRKADFLMKGTSLLFDKIEELRGLPFADEDLSPGRHHEDVHVENGCAPRFLEWTVEDVSKAVKRIAVRIGSGGRIGPQPKTILLISERIGF